MLRHGIRRHDVEPQNDKVLSRRFGQETKVLGIGCLAKLLCARDRLPEGRSLTAVQHPVEKASASWGVASLCRTATRRRQAIDLG